MIQNFGKNLNLIMILLEDLQNFNLLIDLLNIQVFFPVFPLLFSFPFFKISNFFFQKFSLGGARIWLKREDLNHTGAHKINNAVGQVYFIFLFFFERLKSQDVFF